MMNSKELSESDPALPSISLFTGQAQLQSNMSPCIDMKSKPQTFVSAGINGTVCMYGYAYIYIYMLPPLTYLPVWCVYTTGVYLQNFICIGAGDCRFACFLVLLAKYMSDPVPAASQSNSIGDTFAIVSVRNNAQLLSD